MPANYSHHWKTLLAGALGAATVAIPSIAQAQTVAQASGPVTAISELSDVQPTDWAFQALQSLVERYGCIAGYPDRTYRGNRAMTRFEFAAGMNACLDRINELIAAGLADKVSREDLATLQRLQEEFAAELAALKGRVDTIEADVADLQSKVFNPVTKLNVQLITALLGSGLTEDRVIDGELVTESDQANITFPYRLRMNFDASFVGNDRLRVRLQARDANTEFFDGDAPGAFFSGGGGGNVVLSNLTYRFRVFENTTVSIGAVDQGVDERFNYSVPFQTLSDFGGSGPLLTEGPGDSGIAFDTSFSDQFTFAYGYAVDDGQTVGEFGDEGGIGAGNNYHGFELGFIPSDTVGLYFQFATAYFQDATDLNISSLAEDTVRGPLVTNDVAALIDDGAIPAPYGRLNAFSVAAEWQITPSVIFSGWGSFGNLEYKIPDDVPEYIGSPDPGDEDFISWLVGFVFPDLFLEGGEGGFTVGQLPSGDLDGADKPLVVDVYYSLPINDYLNIIPSAYFITNPNGNLEGDNDPTIGVGAIRAEFNY